MNLYFGNIFSIISTLLVICIFAAIRDEYALSVQASIGTEVSPGLFALDSIQSNLSCIGGAVIAFCSLSSIFVRKQGYRKVMFLKLL